MKYKYFEIETQSLLPIYKKIKKGWIVIDKFPRKVLTLCGAQEKLVEGFYVTMRRAK